MEEPQQTPTPIPPFPLPPSFTTPPTPPPPPLPLKKEKKKRKKTDPPPSLVQKKFLKNPSLYKSVSAFAPIANLSACPWGQKALAGYFGPEDRPRWAEHDATELVRKWDSGPLEILVDIVRLTPPFFLLFPSPNPPFLSFSFPSPPFSVPPSPNPRTVQKNPQKKRHSNTPLFHTQGTADPFLSQNQLLPDNFTSAAAQAVGGNVNLRLRWQEGYDHSYYFVASFAEEHVKFAAKFLLG